MTCFDNGVNNVSNMYIDNLFSAGVKQLYRKVITERFIAATELYWGLHYRPFLTYREKIVVPLFTLSKILVGNVSLNDILVKKIKNVIIIT